jgi:hypothetical protein
VEKGALELAKAMSAIEKTRRFTWALEAEPAGKDASCLLEASK